VQIGQQNTTQIQAVVNGQIGVCTVNNGALQCSVTGEKAASAQGHGAVAIGVGAKAQGTGAFAQGSGAQALYAGSVAIGAGAQANADPTTAVGNNAIANGNNSVALGANTTANGSNSVALGQGSVANRANSVSVGNAATGMDRQITNVAPGTQGTDAVNLNQLNAGLATSKAYANAEADKVGSVDASLAAASAEVAAGRYSNTIAGGTAEYNGQSSFALAYQHRFNKHWSAILTASSNGQASDTTVAGAAGYSW
jgi:autotransporter adhesin